VVNRLRAFLDRSRAELRVVAPVPWFPVSAAWAGRYAAFARAPERETRRGIEIRHPRYAIPPKIGMTYAASALERCFLRAARALLAEGWDFDLIDAHYLYPDGVAAVRAARALGKPVVVTARGSDVSLFPRYPRQREMILDAVRRADGVVAVAQALKDELVRLGAPAEKVRILRNGVDLQRFRPLDRSALRAKLGLDGPVVLSVGHLIERKGHHLIVEAIERLPGATLLIVGEGDARPALMRRARELGVADRVRLLGSVPHDTLAEIYSAADALALASSREGWPNVLLESMACGTPVAASPVWGSKEVVAAPEAGRLADARSSEAMAEALAEILRGPWDRAATRAYAERFSWDETADALRDLFGGIIRERRAAAAIRSRPIVATAARPRMIVTVDAEEGFAWGDFDAPSHALCPPEDIGRFQTVAAEFGAKPLYLLTWPLIADAASGSWYRALYERGAADLGIHLHQWATPPLNGYAGEYYSWQCNLPRQVRLAKLKTLADAFADAFGFRARAHRAGRYGISLASYRELADLGVDLDFSPSPPFDFSTKGGPDFSMMANAPFAVEVGETAIAVTPVCGGASLRGTRYFLPDGGAVGFPPQQNRKVWGFTAAARLTCEGAGIDDLVALAGRLVKNGAPVLTFSLHSTSLTPGGNPYAPDERDTARILETCRRFFAFYRDVLGGEFIALDDLASLYGIPGGVDLNLNRTLSARS
jgi:glycosyltransferase involved in cell wall biosynthesis